MRVVTATVFVPFSEPASATGVKNSVTLLKDLERVPNEVPHSHGWERLM
jgi:hypothetical protein